MNGVGLIFGLATAFLVLLIVISALAARELPPTGPVPTHFDIKGKADAFGSRWITLAIVPVSYVLANALILTIGPSARSTPVSQLVTTQVALGLSLLAAHGFVMFLLLRWARSQ